jgi:hypothetical protein
VAEDPAALGPAILAVVLIVPVLLAHAFASGSDPRGGDPSSRAGISSGPLTDSDFPRHRLPPSLPPETSRALGRRVPASCADAREWESLPRIGPARAIRLAEAAAGGELREPADLLRIDGIGPKMAAGLEPWIEWPRGEVRR